VAGKGPPLKKVKERWPVL